VITRVTTAFTGTKMYSCVCVCARACVGGGGGEKDRHNCQQCFCMGKLLKDRKFADGTIFGRTSSRGKNLLT